MKLFHPFATALSVAGREYKVVKGWVEVAEEHAAALLDHGFSHAKPKAAAAVEPASETPPDELIPTDPTAPPVDAS